MNNSLKGVFLSGLVFPGLGQIILKKYKRGIALMLTVLVCLLAIVLNAVQQALAILEKIDLKDGNVDFSTVSNAANNALSNSDSLTINFSLILIILCWIIGTVDAYRIGRKKDLEKRLTHQI
jgi:ABC-type spermidine/putrescine transport system permease subunit I